MVKPIKNIVSKGWKGKETSHYSFGEEKGREKRRKEGKRGKEQDRENLRFIKVRV